MGPCIEKEELHRKGGVERAPMSTSRNRQTAFEYAGCGMQDQMQVIGLGNCSSWSAVIL